MSVSTESLVLLPRPHALVLAGGTFDFSQSLALEAFQQLLANPPAGLRFQVGSTVDFATSSDKSEYQEQSAKAGNTARIAPDIAPPSRPIEYNWLPSPSTARRDRRSYQAYSLSIAPDGITITASSQNGAFNGLATLIQIAAQSDGQLPCLTIDDHPDFARRGVMLDISRDKVPTLDTLKALILKLAGWKINELQLYTEHTFAYQGHATVWKDASPLTAADIRQLDLYCRALFIDLVPNQNSFGHFHRWLMHEDYAHLAEFPEGFDWSIFISKRPFSLNAGDPATFDLLTELYDELLPNFSSKYFNVGCDETFDLGKGRSKEMVEAQGRGQVYLDYLKRVSALVKGHGRVMQFWGDIIMEHPELAAELPKDMIALEWGYDADHPFARDGERFAAAGVPFYVCPGTSSWISLLGRTHNTLENQVNAAKNGLKHGAMGYLNTDWGDFGHWQALPVSYLGFAYGAALSWGVAANEGVDLIPALNHFAFEDAAGVMGRLAYEMGNVYRILDDHKQFNGALMVRALYTPIADFEAQRWWDAPINADKVRAAMQRMESLVGELEMVRMADPLVIEEYRLAAALWLHGCKRLLLKTGDAAVSKAGLLAELIPLRAEFERLWLARNRPGGLSDSLVRVDRLIAEYEGQV